MLKLHSVKISPHMSQKWLRFGDDVGACDFMKFAKKYHQQVEEECANIGRLTVHAASPVADTGRILQEDHVISHMHKAPDHGM